MAAQLIDFCRGVAMVLQGESLKAQCYVTHNQSLGVLREKMVRNFIRHESPERYRVETGLIRNHQTGHTSRQCDLLVHDPSQNPPLYRWEDFVVVHTGSARAVVEVKTTLEDREFKQLLEVQDSVSEVQNSDTIRTFGYALDGVKFGTFLDYISMAVIANRLGLTDPAERDVNWPFCVVVQSRRYIGICPARSNEFIAVDFTKAKEESFGSDGVETGMFLWFYTKVLEGISGLSGISSTFVHNWFNSIEIESDGKAWVDTSGTIHYGNIPTSFPPT